MKIVHRLAASSQRCPCPFAATALALIGVVGFFLEVTAFYAVLLAGAGAGAGAGVGAGAAK